ncbi:MAG: hypothetical protein HC769_32815 [Cyanobacteria bacterium CRU_2_1]|nr:hypothetical protein [Cyanobacteria bacterium CRU_2_1]
MSINERSEPAGWLFQIAPAPGESFGHYLGRFRRANCLSRIGLAEFLATDVRVVRGWEMPSLGQSLSAVELAKVATLLGLSVVELREMLPEERSKPHLATRLCPRCYADRPVHQRDWQRADLAQCQWHAQPLLAACSVCGSGFRLPALWENGCCEQCWLPFREMVTAHPAE